MDEWKANFEMRLQKVESAFPGGDAEGHRRYHEAIIALTEEKRKLRVAIQEKTISGLIWSAILFLVHWLWNQLASWVHPQ